jgi:putative CocE/NonD family hydrolase
MRASISATIGCVLCAVVGLAAAAEEPHFAAPGPRTNDVVVDNRVPVAMRDGVVLYADVYRPAGEGRYPVIVGRTPYSIERYATPVYEYPNAYEAPLFFASRGYVFVYQDIRGRYESDGKWEPFRNDIDDGYDTVEWAARQPWSNGKVGMQGVSYEGTVQWRAAMSAPPHLVTIVPSVASTSLYHDWVTSNGAWRLGFNLEWGAIRMESRTTQNSGPNLGADAPESLAIARIQRHLPLADMPRIAGRHSGAFYQDWIAHPNYDDYWRAIDAEEAFDRIRIPVLNFGGWFDLFRQGTLRGYSGLRARGGSELAREQTRLVIGAYGHWPTRRVGELDFGPSAFIDQNALALEWFDYWLKGADNGVRDRAPVRLFVMGLNQWRDEDDFPPARAQPCKLYLQSGGALAPRPQGGSAPADHYVYDPANPAPAVGGASDVRRFEQRPDVLTYTSNSLTDDLEVIGPLSLTLYAASDAPDTDFVGRLVDVYPDGRALAIADGILRARYRESTSQPQWLTPGKVYRLKIDLSGTAILFPQGHRLRVEITSSAFPAFDRNLNTTEPFGAGTEMRKARQSVYHTAAYPSHLLLSVTNAVPSSRRLATSACVR